MRRIFLGLSLCLGLVVLATPARADIPPENACQNPGDACDNAPPDYKSKGVCQTQRCSRQLPGPNGIEKHEYDCNLCLPPDPAAKTAASAAPPAANKKGACSVAAGAGSPVGALLLVALLVVARRRRAA